MSEQCGREDDDGGDKNAMRNDRIDKGESRLCDGRSLRNHSHHTGVNPFNLSTNIGDQTCEQKQPEWRQRQTPAPSTSASPPAAARGEHSPTYPTAIKAGSSPLPPQLASSLLVNRRRYTDADINELREWTPTVVNATTPAIVHAHQSPQPQHKQTCSDHNAIKTSVTLSGSRSTGLINCRSSVNSCWESVDLSTSSACVQKTCEENYSASHALPHSPEAASNDHSAQSVQQSQQQLKRKFQHQRHSAIIINIINIEEADDAAEKLATSLEDRHDDQSNDQPPPKRKGVAEIIGRYRAKFLHGGLNFIEPFNPDSASSAGDAAGVVAEGENKKLARPTLDSGDGAEADEAEDYWMLEWLQSGWQSATHAVTSPFERLPPFSLPHSSNLINLTSSLTCRGPTKRFTSPKLSTATYDVFLGGSCGNTVWRSELVIPYLKKRSISYYDPQRPVWSENLIYEEAMAKENSRLFLFVLDPGTINATSFLEIAYFAARKAPKLVVVFLGRHEWSDKAHPLDLPDRIRTCNLLEAILKRHNVPMLTTINEALDCVDEMIIGRKRWSDALATPKQRGPFIRVKARQALIAAKGHIRRSVHYFHKRLSTVAAWGAALLIVQAVATIVLHFFLLEAVPLAWIVLPFIVIDYALLFITLAVMRIKKHRRRKQTANKHHLHLPPMPIPRVNSSTFSSGCGSNFAAFEPATLYRTITSEVNHPLALPPLKSSRSHVDFGQLRLVDQPPSLVTATPHLHSSMDGCVQIAELCPPSPPPSLQLEGLLATCEGEGGRRLSRKERMQMHGCLTSPIGYDVFLSCSSASELDWMTQRAIPQLHKSGLSYTSAVMYDLDKELRIPPLHTASHLLYYVPSYKTFLSGMIEIAYFIGHDDWQVTVCIPKEAECLVYLEKGRGEHVDVDAMKAIQRRNECYRMAFCYLKDLAQRQQCRVFTNVEEAIRHIATQNEQDRCANDACRDAGSNPLPPSPRRAALRQILAKQHLVRERTQANLLAHLKAKSASLESNASSSLTIPSPSLPVASLLPNRPST